MDIFPLQKQAGNTFQHRRLARTVPANNADFFRSPHQKRYVSGKNALVFISVLHSETAHRKIKDGFACRYTDILSEFQKNSVFGLRHLCHFGRFPLIPMFQRLHCFHLFLQQPPAVRILSGNSPLLVFYSLLDLTEFLLPDFFSPPFISGLRPLLFQRSLPALPVFSVRRMHDTVTAHTLPAQLLQMNDYIGRPLDQRFIMRDINNGNL